LVAFMPAAAAISFGPMGSVASPIAPSIVARSLVVRTTLASPAIVQVHASLLKVTASDEVAATPVQDDVAGRIAL